MPTLTPTFRTLLGALWYTWRRVVSLDPKRIYKVTIRNTADDWFMDGWRVTIYRRAGGDD